MPKVVFVNRYAHPDHSATSQMVSDLAFALVRRGHAVEMVASRQLYEDAGARLAQLETVDGVTIRRVWTSRFGRAGLVGRAIDYLTFYLSAAAAVLAATRRGDVVVVKTDPPLMSVVLAPVVRLRGGRLVNWLQDVFPEVAQSLGVGRGRLAGFGYALLRRLRNRSLRAADANVVIGERMAERLAAEGVGRDRVRIIENWADGSLVHPVAPAQNPLRAAWGLADAFVVGYSGNLGRAHEFATLVGAIADVERCKGDDIRWLMIGGGALQEAFAAEIATRDLRSVVVHPYQPRERLADSLSAADVHLVSLRPEMEGLIVPSKIYGILAAGRPAVFIGDPDGEVARLIRRLDCGVTVREGDPAALAEAVRGLAVDPQLAEAMGARARAAFERAHDLEAAVRAWDALLGSLGAVAKS